MGLRLVAHYYDRSEALIVTAALDAAGIPAFLENYHQVHNQPLSEIALGGYRLMVVLDDIDGAVSVLREARSAPLVDGEALASTYWLPGPIRCAIALLWLNSVFAPFGFALHPLVYILGWFVWPLLLVRVHRWVH